MKTLTALICAVVAAGYVLAQLPIDDLAACEADLATLRAEQEHNLKTLRAITERFGLGEE